MTVEEKKPREASNVEWLQRQPFYFLFFFLVNSSDDATLRRAASTFFWSASGVPTSDVRKARIRAETGGNKAQWHAFMPWHHSAAWLQDDPLGSMAP